MKKLTLLFITSILLLTGCSSGDNKESIDSISSSGGEISESSSTQDGGEYQRIVSVKVMGQKSEYPTFFTYKDSLFDHPSYEFDKQLAIFALGASMAAGDLRDLTLFYSGIGFEHLCISHTYHETSTENSVDFVIGHHDNIVIATFRGFDYKAQWVNNFDLGSSGDHQGFKRCAETFVPIFDNYLMEYHLENAKILLTGYSRGGAIANVAADILLKNNSSNRDNYYVYTFEAPQGLNSHTEYPNVFNIVNDADLVPLFAPKQYEMYRCGRDINIYSSDIDEMAKEYNKNEALPEFYANDDFDNDVEFLTKLFNLLIEGEVSKRPINTRELFVENAEDTIKYLMRIFFSLSGTALAKLYLDVSAKSQWELLSLISSGSNLKEFLETYLILDGYEYDEAELLSHCEAVSELIMEGPFSYVLTYYVIAKDNLMRSLAMHYPLYNYLLLKKYNPEVE